MARVFTVALAYVLSLAVTGVAAFFLVLLFAGPHGGILPDSFQGIVLIIGWLAVLVIPLLVARWVWKRRGE